MTYQHGISVSEVPTSILPPVTVGAGLPVVFGTAPVNMAANPAEQVNKPILASTYQEAVSALGFVPANESTGVFDYTLCEFMRSHFALFAVAPVVFVNVLDPATHTTTVADDAVTLVTDSVTIAQTGILLSTLVVTDSTGDTTYVAGDDYVAAFDADGGVTLTRTDDGDITANEELLVTYDHLDTTQIADADIIGGIDVDGAATGLELVEEVFPRFRLVPGQILAPKYSGNSAVAAVMNAKAGNVNGTFRAISLVDVPTGDVDNYTDVAAWKESNNITDPQQVVCWPKVKLGAEQFHLSTQLAGLMCLVDSQNGDVPYISPSNKNLRADSAVLENGTEVFLNRTTAALLNGQGIVTALNFVGGWTAWGNRTGAYPGNTDPKDAFISVRRMFNWIGNTLALTFWQRLDAPLNRRQIQTVVDSANIFLNGLAAQGYLVGDRNRVEFLADENPTTDLLDGIARFHVYITPPSPNRQIDFILEYDVTNIESLFG
jgi:phage tail sheath protein FI